MTNQTKFAGLLALFTMMLIKGGHSSIINKDLVNKCQAVMGETVIYTVETTEQDVQATRKAMPAIQIKDEKVVAFRARLQEFADKAAESPEERLAQAQIKELLATCQGTNNEPLLALLQEHKTKEQRPLLPTCAQKCGENAAKAIDEYRGLHGHSPLEGVYVWGVRFNGQWDSPGLCCCVNNSWPKENHVKTCDKEMCEFNTHGRFAGIIAPEKIDCYVKNDEFNNKCFGAGDKNNTPWCFPLGKYQEIHGKPTSIGCGCCAKDY